MLSHTIFSIRNEEERRKRKATLGMLGAYEKAKKDESLKKWVASQRAKAWPALKQCLACNGHLSQECHLMLQMQVASMKKNWLLMKIKGLRAMAGKQIQEIEAERFRRILFSCNQFLQEEEESIRVLSFEANLLGNSKGHPNWLQVALEGPLPVEKQIDQVLASLRRIRGARKRVLIQDKAATLEAKEQRLMEELEKLRAMPTMEPAGDNDLDFVKGLEGDEKELWDKWDSLFKEACKDLTTKVSSSDASIVASIMALYARSA